jgi:pimeloyl-ACP methyl ester carboxylesterase
MTTQTVRVGRLRVRVHRQGQGRPLLLVNGLGASLEMWSPLRPHLPNREIVSFDLPGSGGSSVPWLPRRMQGLANLVVTLLGELRISRADVLGYSFGGIVAQELARRHPSSVDGLILAATAAGWPSWPPNPHVTLLMMTPARYHDRRLARAILPVIAGGRTARDRSVLMDSVERRVASPPSTIGYFQQLYAATGWTSQRWLGSLEQRTLVLHGSKDPIVPVVNARLMARRIKRASLAEVAGAGHLLLFDEPERCGEEICRFLGDGRPERTPAKQAI